MKALKGRLSGQEKGGIAAVAVGIVTLILAALLAGKEEFWIPYADGFRATGWMLVFVGTVWFAFSAAQIRTSFFDLNRRMDADKFGLSIAAAALGVIIAIFIVVPRLPATEQSALPIDPNAREQVIRREQNFRYYSSIAIVLTGLAIGACPAIRFFRK